MNLGTPIQRSFASAAGALAYVRRQMDGLEASAQWNENVGEFVPVAMLRSDQGFLRDRLEERGIKCVLDPATNRHVSEMMVRAGADVLLAELQVFSSPEDIARRVYAAMEAKR